MEPTELPSADASQPTIPLTGTIPATDADAVGQVGRKKTKEKLPRNLRRLFGWIFFIAIVPNLAFGFVAFMSAVQAQQIDPEGKVQALAVISAISALAAMLAQPIIGVLSDRTRSRFGSRRPWILFGGMVGAMALITAGLAPSIAWLTVAVVFVQFGFNALGGPLSAILPDRVPVRFRGRYSTLAGLGGLIGSIAGGIVASTLVGNIALGYACFAGVLLLVVVLFVTTVGDRDNRGEQRAPFSLLAFLKAFWVNPVRYPDFFWGFTGRFLIFGANALPTTYSLYILQDYVGLPVEQSIQIAPLLGLAAIPTILLSTAIAGPLSDRIGRRKPIVLISGLIIVAAAIIPIVSPTILGMVISGLLIGLGFGAFIAVDQALMSQVLPDKEKYGTDLGVLNIAATLPGVIGPAVSGVIVLVFGTYGALYAATAIVGLVGALAVIPIKSVR